jgi:protein ImuB
LFRLFDTKLDSVEPDMGIELFVLTAPKTEPCIPQQEAMWKTSGDLSDVRLSEFIDRIASRIGTQSIQRFLPDEHHWPDRSFKATHALTDETSTAWSSGELRPFHVLQVPQRIDVSAPIPDYPPMVFRYQGKVHSIQKADGPERIEPEWMQPGQFRDYYRVEDTDGRRYWLFREGPYEPGRHAWFLHGFFA